MSTPPSPPAPAPTGGEAAPAAAPAQMLPTPVILGAMLRSAKNVSDLIFSPSGVIDVETGLAHATNPGNLRLELADLAGGPPPEATTA